MLFNLTRSAPIAFNICAIRGSSVLYLTFFREEEVLRGVCRLVMCLKISGRIFLSENAWITMNCGKELKTSNVRERGYDFPPNQTPSEAFMNWKILSKFSQDFCRSENASIIMQRILSG